MSARLQPAHSIDSAPRVHDSELKGILSKQDGVELAVRAGQRVRRALVGRPFLLCASRWPAVSMWRGADAVTVTMPH